MYCLAVRSNGIGSHAGSIILRVTYGYKSQAKDDALVEVADKAIRGLDHALIPGYYLVDYFPLLKWVPSKVIDVPRLPMLTNLFKSLVSFRFLQATSSGEREVGNYIS